MVTACKMDLEMEEFKQTIAEAWNRLFNIFSSGFNHTKPRNHQTAHKSKNKSNSRIKKQKCFFSKILNSNY
jgi:hypothetical protein